MSSDTLPAISTQTDVDPAILERVVCDGDLSRLTPPQRVAWYRARCDAAGLDPRTQPFQYVTLNSKLILYATKTATDQLIAKHDITVRILSRTFDEQTGVYEVVCSASLPNGRTAEDIGTVYLGKMSGEPLANAVMKAVTKAKRRTILSACGLGMLDETELETIPGVTRAPDSKGHHAINHDNGTGYGSGAYAAPEIVADYREWARQFIELGEQRWADFLTTLGPDAVDAAAIEPRCKVFLNGWKLTEHLFKWARERGYVNAPDDARQGQKPGFLAVAWERNRREIIREAEKYAAAVFAEKRALILPDEDEGDPDCDYPEPGSEG